MTDTAFKSNLLFAEVFLPSYADKSMAFSGYVKSISSQNAEGSFDVLPLHANFLTTFQQGLVMVDEAGKRIELNLPKGLIEVSNNFVRIFAEF